MAAAGPNLKNLSRNIAFATTGLLVLLGGLGQFEILFFLHPFRVPLVALTATSWAGFYLVKTLLDPGRGVGKQIVTAEGPGEEVIQKATLASLQQQPDFEAGSVAEEEFVKGEQRFLAFRYGEAAAYYRKALDAKQALPTFLNLGAALLNSSEFEQAQEVLGMGLQMAQRMEKRLFEAAFHANLGTINSRLANYEAAAAECTTATDLFRGVGDSRGQADVLLTVGNLQLNQGNRDQARRTFEQALKRYEIVKSSLGRANALGNLGNLHLGAADFDEALKHHQRALEIHEQTGNPLGRANALSNLGNVRFRTEKHDEALKAYRAALKVYEQIGASLGSAGALANVGNVLRKQGKGAEALSTYEQALEVHTEVGNALGKANTLTNMGSLYSRMRQDEDALDCLRQARRIYETVGARTSGLAAAEELIRRITGGKEAAAAEGSAPEGDSTQEGSQAPPGEAAPDDDSTPGQGSAQTEGEDEEEKKGGQPT